MTNETNDNPPPLDEAELTRLAARGKELITLAYKVSQAMPAEVDNAQAMAVFSLCIAVLLKKSPDPIHSYFATMDLIRDFMKAPNIEELSEKAPQED